METLRKEYRNKTYMSFLVFASTTYLKDNCVKIVLSKSGLLRSFALITAPDHLCKELIKLNGIDFDLHCLSIEESPVNTKMTGPSLSDKKKIATKNYQTPVEGIQVVPGENIIRKQQVPMKIFSIPFTHSITKRYTYAKI